jgi:hypothetical protein
VPHKVSNEGETDRVHLVVDVTEETHPRIDLAPGAVCDYDLDMGLLCMGGVGASGGEGAVQGTGFTGVSEGAVQSPPSAAAIVEAERAAAAAREAEGEQLLQALHAASTTGATALLTKSGEFTEEGLAARAAVMQGLLEEHQRQQQEEGGLVGVAEGYGQGSGQVLDLGAAGPGYMVGEVRKA